MDLPGRLGPCELTRRIGAGGMGVVYEGSYDGARVAVKVIRAELAEDEEFRARFRREITLMRRVHGACTARVVAADPDGDPPYLATEFLSGPTLTRHLRTHGPMNPTLVRALAVGLAEALMAIHEAGVVHRDLKPGNVLLTPTGPKVVDFGIAQAADVTVLTRVGTAIGSPGYMSPEQVGGYGTGPATDVFSWACTVAYAATGRSPFGDGPTDAVLFRVRHDPPNLAGVPADLHPLLFQALTKDPARRPDSPSLVRSLLVGTEDDGVNVDEADTRLLSDAVTRIIAAEWSKNADVPPAVPGDTGGGFPAAADVVPPERRRRLRVLSGHRRRPVVGAIAGALLLSAFAAGAQMKVLGGEGSGASLSSATAGGSTASISPTAPGTTSGAGSAGEEGASVPAAAGSPSPTSIAPPVTADRLEPGVRLFTDAMYGDDKAWVWEIQGLQGVMYGGSEGLGFDAPLLGAWWSLADWCSVGGHGRPGECYDLASNFVTRWFDRDPRKINTETWAGAGAVAGNVIDGHGITEKYLRAYPKIMTVDALFPGRPGHSFLCEPDCVTVIDGGR
ncbi:serine/threonine-protein kinase [Parafrankia elaeagni]|uniref:serine/threonine-protein kinase n=1 Tax=Parafrankia elaeagni TaxID=222534 RepID=UPI001E5B5EBE|nr:serine/threonine-protein kinase [Parafrankia elaeagni]